jgi:RNA polymerase sigma-70 factor (ECF subfamily)
MWEASAIMQDDAILVAQAKQGEPAAFELIYDQHRQPIFNYIYFRVGDSKLAEDLTSDVFVRMVDKIDTYTQNGRPLAAWLYTIARNLVIDHHRRDNQLDWVPLDERLIESKDHNPDKATDHGLLQECLMKALQHLTEDQRQVILLKFMERRSNAEVGSILGKTEGSIKSLQHRALAALKRALDKELCYER